MHQLKALIPNSLKNAIKTLIDFVEWIHMYRTVPVVLTDTYGVKFLVYPWNKTFLNLSLSAHDHVKEFTALSKLIKAGDTVFDVGANVGLLCVYVAKLATESGVVHAFEPVAETYAMLEETIALNRSKNVVAHHMGLGNATTTSEIFTFDAALHSLNSLGQVNIGGTIPTRTETIQLSTLDDFCTKHQITAIDMLKVDVEGFEDAVFQGARTMLQNGQVKYIQFEISEMPLSSIGKNSQDIFTILNRLSYQVYRFNLATQKFEGPIATKDNDFDNYYASREDLTLLS